MNPDEDGKFRSGLSVFRSVDASELTSERSQRMDRENLSREEQLTSYRDSLRIDQMEYLSKLVASRLSEVSCHRRYYQGNEVEIVDGGDY